MFRHILPNAVAPVLVSMAFGVASAILLESGLSFLGIGVPQHLVTWGSILSESRASTFAWWLAVFPGSRDLRDGDGLQPARRRSCAMRSTRSSTFAEGPRV